MVGLLSLLDLLLLVLKDLLIQGVGNLDVGGLPGGKIGGGINNGSLGKNVNEKWLKDPFLEVVFWYLRLTIGVVNIAVPGGQRGP